jgi:asparagine synthase (glutamine-hydrolysing)
MCGIAGGVNCRIDLPRLAEDLRHRGPDEFGVYEKKGVRLCHTRLAIQDIAGGKQPMEREDCVIVFNGEIYNHRHLRETLLDGVAFTTDSDTETLLLLYRKFGEKMFGYLDGMYAFAIHDRGTNSLFFAVDRAGKKPLYLYREGERLFFASELRALRHQVDPLIEEEAIAAYLRLGFFPESITPYRKVERLRNGSWLAIDLNDFSERRGWHFDMERFYREGEVRPLEGSEALERLDKALEKSVKDRMLSSDREVGAFLSGGIDSSLVVAKASRYAGKLKTFTVAFEGGYDESELARLTAERYGTEHHTLRITMDLKENVEGILAAYGQPFMDSSAIPSWYVSQAAKERVTVVLNGDGADELFGGYRRYVPLANGWMRWGKALAPLAHFLPLPAEKQSAYNYLYRLLRMAGKKGIDLYLSATSDIFEDYYSFPSNEIIEKLNQRVLACKLPALERMLCLDFELLLFSDLLVKMDIATMAHSLEARSPFLGKGVLELAPQIATSEKIRGASTKWILRHLAKRYLPKELITQPKRGFEVPLKRWVEGELKEPIYDRLSQGAYSENFIERPFIERLLKGDPAISPEKRAKMLWTLYALEVWKESL